MVDRTEAACGGPLAPARLVSSHRDVARDWILEHPLLAVAVLALVARLLLSGAIAALSGGALFGDDARYLELARQMASHNVWSWTAYDAELYTRTGSLMWPVTVMFEIVGGAAIWAQLYVALLGTAVAVLTTRLGMWFLQRSHALLAGVIVALLPSQVLWSSLVMKDAVVWFALVGIAIAVVVAQTARAWRLAACYAVILTLVVTLGFLRFHTMEIVLVALFLTSALGASDGRVLRMASAGVILLCVPMAFGMGWAGLTFLGNTGSLADRRAANAIGANTAVVAPLPPSAAVAAAPPPAPPQLPLPTQLAQVSVLPATLEHARPVRPARAAAQWVTARAPGPPTHAPPARRTPAGPTLQWRPAPDLNERHLQGVLPALKGRPSAGGSHLHPVVDATPARGSAGTTSGRLPAAADPQPAVHAGGPSEPVSATQFVDVTPSQPALAGDPATGTGAPAPPADPAADAAGAPDVSPEQLAPALGQPAHAPAGGESGAPALPPPAPGEDGSVAVGPPSQAQGGPVQVVRHMEPVLEAPRPRSPAKRSHLQPAHKAAPPRPSAAKAAPARPSAPKPAPVRTHARKPGSRTGPIAPAAPSPRTPNRVGRENPPVARTPVAPPVVPVTPAVPAVPAAPGGESVLSYAPKGMTVIVLRPLPWEALAPGRAPGVRLAGAEDVFWYPLLALALCGLFALRGRVRFMAFPLLVGVATVFMYGMTEGNVGTAYRHRGEFVWVVALLAARGVQHLAGRRRARPVARAAH